MRPLKTLKGPEHQLSQIITEVQIQSKRSRTQLSVPPQASLYDHTKPNSLRTAEEEFKELNLS